MASNAGNDEIILLFGAREYNIAVSFNIGWKSRRWLSSRAALKLDGIWRAWTRKPSRRPGPATKKAAGAPRQTPILAAGPKTGFSHFKPNLTNWAFPSSSATHPN
jgi:hypothetical protein